MPTLNIFGLPLRLVLILGAVLATIGCGSESSAPPVDKVVRVTVATPLVMPIVEWDEYTGRLEATDSVEVRARVSGYLQETYFQEGQHVKKGDLIAVIDPRPFEAEFRAASAQLTEAQAKLKEATAKISQSAAEKVEAEAKLSLAKGRYDRGKELARTNAVSREQLQTRTSEFFQAKAILEGAKAKLFTSEAAIETAKASIETAKAEVQLATLNLEYTRVRAPIEGRTSKRMVTEGNLIQGGTSQATLLTTIVSMNPIHCYFDANEQAFLKYVRLARAGKRTSSREAKNPVYVALVDEKGSPHKGHMDFVDNQLDPNTGTMRGRAILPNPDLVLTPGLFTSVRLPGSERYNAVLIPDSAVGSDQSEKFVYTLNGDQSVKRQPVELGSMSHGLRIVRKGLNGSEQIVTHGLQGLYPGIKVAPQTETIKADIEANLPDDYQPVPEKDWLSRTPPEPPKDIEGNKTTPPTPKTEPTDPKTMEPMRPDSKAPTAKADVKEKEADQ